MPKHEAQEIVASREPQYLQSGSSVDVAAPHIGQLSVSAFISRILTVEVKLDYEWRLCDLATISTLVRRYLFNKISMSTGTFRAKPASQK